MRPQHVTNMTCGIHTTTNRMTDLGSAVCILQHGLTRLTERDRVNNLAAGNDGRCTATLAGEQGLIVVRVVGNGV